MQSGATASFSSHSLLVVFNRLRKSNSPTKPTFYSSALHLAHFLPLLKAVFSETHEPITQSNTDPLPKTPTMPRKTRSFSQKVMGLLKISIFVAKRLRRPITAKMGLLRESRKANKFRLLCRYKYNHGFLEEFQFSPCGRNRFKDSVRDCRDDLLSMVFMCKCLGGGLNSEADDELGGFRDFPLPLATIGGVDEEEDDEDEEDNSVDRRAERFIERFYQEMRLQRRLSL